MYRREFIIFSAVTLFLFALVAATSLLMEQALQHDAQMLSVDSLPGVVNAGDAMSRVNDNWQNLNLLPDLPASTSRSNLIAQIMANSTTNFWLAYQRSIFEPRDKVLFAQMQGSRSRYVALIQQYFDLVNEQKLDEARQLLETQIKPAFQKYKGDAAGLFQLNADIGQQRARHIVELSRWLPWLAGFFCLVIFSFGLVVGLKGAFGSLAFASRIREHPDDKAHPAILTNWR